MSDCTCTWCGQSFAGKRSDSLFCNPVCKQKYWRWKHRLDLIRTAIMYNIDECMRYLEEPNTEHLASLVLGETADRLAAFGFVATTHQMSLPEEAYAVSNQLGGKDD